MTTTWKRPGTAIAAIAWVTVCAYLHFTWPSLAALLQTLVPPGGDPLVRLPRVAFPALGVLTVFGLILKNRCLPSPMALVVDAVVGAPAFLLLALLLHPFLIPVE